MSEDRRAWDPTGGEDDTDVYADVWALISDSVHFFRYYLDDCKALVFVVDSSDRMRMPEAQKALKKILVEEKLSDVPLMVLANKKDLPNCMTIREVNVNLEIWVDCCYIYESLCLTDFHWAGSGQCHWQTVGDPGLQRSERTGSSAGLQFHQQNYQKELTHSGAAGSRSRESGHQV